MQRKSRRVPGYNPGMKLRDISPVTRLLIGAAVYVVVVVVALGMLAGWSELLYVAVVVLFFGAPFAGAGLIYGLVRHVNRRDGPRNAGSPAER